jgi:hypothetical protein
LFPLVYAAFVIHANFMAEAANISRFSLLYRHRRGADMRKEILLAI